jgi:small subunit ribosomal protein S20
MPITKSAKKSIRKDKKRTAINIQRKNKVKDLVKKVNNLIAQGKKEEAKKLLPQIYKTLDKTAKTGIVKKNNTSRRKSRITKSINKIKK